MSAEEAKTGFALVERKLERVVKGFANHRRIRMMALLEKSPELSLEQVAQQTRVGMKTASEHLRRLAIAGLVGKRHDGRWVRHKLSARGVAVLKFLKSLD